MATIGTSIKIVNAAKKQFISGLATNVIEDQTCQIVREIHFEKVKSLSNHLDIFKSEAFL